MKTPQYGHPRISERWVIANEGMMLDTPLCYGVTNGRDRLDIMTKVDDVRWVLRDDLDDEHACFTVLDIANDILPDGTILRETDWYKYLQELDKRYWED